MADDLQARLNRMALDLRMEALRQGTANADPMKARIEAARAGTLEVPQERLEAAAAADQIAADRMAIAESGGVARGLAAKAVQGYPFIGSWMDEAFNALDPGRGDRLTTLQDAMGREYPKSSLASSIGGGVLATIPVALMAGPAIGVRAASTIGGRAFQGLGLGVAAGGFEGLVSGAGTGTDAASRASGAARGGAAGAAIGGVVGAVAPYAAAGVKNLIQRLRTSDVNVISRELNVSPPAARVIKNALDSGDDAAAMAAINRAGGDAMLADAGGATQQLLDTAAQFPGGAGATARKAISERTSAASAKMVAALDDALGPPRGAKEIMGEVRRSTAGARNTAYQRAYAAPIDYSSNTGRGLETLLSRVPDSAIKRANALMRLRGWQSAQIMASVADDGTVTYMRMPDVRQLDYITRALNDVASEADGAGKLGGQTALGSSVSNLSKSIRDVLRRAVPEYGDALETAADAISRKEGVEIGYDLLRTGTRREDIARAVSRATGPEKEAMRQGVRSFIDDVTANVSRTITDDDVAAREGIKILREMSSRANQTKMRMLLGDSADTLLREIDEAATAFELRAAIAQNSKTAARQATISSVNAETSGGVISTIRRGEPVGATKRIVQALTGETDEAIALREMGLYREIADALVNTRGENAREALRIITNARAGQAISDQQAQMIARVLVLTGSSTGVPAAGREVTRPLMPR